MNCHDLTVEPGRCPHTLLALFFFSAHLCSFVHVDATLDVYPFALADFVFYPFAASFCHPVVFFLTYDSPCIMGVFIFSILTWLFAWRLES